MNLRSGRIAKILYKLSFNYLKVLKILNEEKWRIAYKKLLRKYGMDIPISCEGYIDPTVYFDNYDYSQIHLGTGVTLSREVLVLLHDWSISAGLIAKGCQDRGYFLKDIVIEDNCFIGARTTLLPGTYIGKNSIVGSCAVVKGKIPENSIVVGNPAKVIGNTLDWTKRHKKLEDYIKT